MSDVFISYVEEDADIVEPLAQGLTEAGYSCWYYQRSSLPGPSYLAQISEALAAAKVVLLVLSPNTLESHQVDKEISFAHECNKPFLPITRNLAWGEFQQRRPTWRLAVGTSVAIPIPSAGVQAILARVAEGLQGLRVNPTATSSDPKAPMAPGERPLRAGGAVPATWSAVPNSEVGSPASHSTAMAALLSDVAVPGALPTRATLVGRTAELHLLKAQFDLAAAGQGGRLVLVSGEPGVGKTRLAHEIGLYAWNRGGLFLEGTYPREGSAPYGPWVDALRLGLRGFPREALAAIAASYGGELAQLFPELAAQFGPWPQSAQSPEEQRRRLLDGLAELVVELSRQRPLVLLLNDLHWAPSLAALCHLSRRLGEARALVIGTAREQELQEQPILKRDWLELNRERLAVQIALQPLAEAESGQLIASYFGDGAAATLRAPVYRRTRGNAFFIEEILRSLSETGAVRRRPDGWEVTDSSLVVIPKSVKAVVEERVSRLGVLARETLVQAAVLGQEFGFLALQRLTRKSEDELFEVVERALSSQLLVDCSVAGEERFAFADDQVQEVLYESLTPLRRRRLHLAAAQILETLYAGQIDRHVEELAYHFRRGNDATKALEFAIRAGERAYAATSWERAAVHFENAKALLTEMPADLPRLAEVLERLADLDAVLGRTGLSHTQEALEVYLRLGNKRKAARMHRLLGHKWSSGSAGRSDWSKVLAHTEAGVALLATEPDSAEKASCLCGLSVGLVSGPLDLDRSLATSREALAIAERLGDDDQIAEACTFIAIALAYRGNLADAERYAERSYLASLHGSDPLVQIMALLYPVWFWPWRNDSRWLTHWWHRYVEARQRLHVGRFDRVAYSFAALYEVLMGRPSDATANLTRAAEISAQRPNAFSYSLFLVGATHQILGDWSRAAGTFAEVYDWVQQAHSQRSLVEASVHYGRFLLASSDLVRAGSVLARGQEMAAKTGSVLQEINLLQLLGELQIRTGDIGAAEATLARARELLDPPEERRGLLADALRAAGLLATAKEDWPAAELAFSNALATERDQGFLYSEAQILVPWAELYFQRHEPGDLERGLEKLDQALGIFERCAAEKDVEKALARRAEMAS